MALSGDTKRTSLDHALHNEKVGKHLDRDPAFADWVITTSFYSALHFVQHKIFPLKQKDSAGNKFDIPNFTQYYKAFNVRRLDKHKLLADLVYQHCLPISPAYDQLRDMSWTARYNQFQFDRTISNLSKQLLKEIKSFCYPHDANP